MQIDPVVLLGEVNQMSPVSTNMPTSQPGQFYDLVVHGVERVNDSLLEAQSLTRSYAVDSTVDLQDVMLAVEEANLSFQFANQIKTKLTEAVQEVLRMQV